MEEFLFSYGVCFPLYIEGAPAFNRRMIARGTPWNDELPLYTSGNLSAANSLLLVLNGTGVPCSGGLDLYCHNDTILASLPLVTIGEGVNDDYMPVDNSLMLYIKCAYGAVLPLYMYGGPQPSANESLDLYTLGGATVTNSLDLSIPNVTDSLTDTITLYTHGF